MGRIASLYLVSSVAGKPIAALTDKGSWGGPPDRRSSPIPMPGRAARRSARASKTIPEAFDGRSVEERA
jgi:hypothetical protein